MPLGISIHILGNQYVHRSGFFPRLVDPTSSLTGTFKMRLFAGALIFSILLIATLAHAQLETLRATTPEQRASAATDFMQKTLELSETDTKRVFEINLASAKKAEPLLKSSDSRFAIGLKLRTINSERAVKLKNLLSTKQWNTLEQSKSEMRKAILSILQNDTDARAD